MMDGDSDDDAPLVFKRRDVARQPQLNTEMSNSSAQPDKLPGKVPAARPLSSHASGSPKEQTSKPSSSKPPANQKPSTLSGKVSPLKPTTQTSASSSGSQAKKAPIHKEERPKKDVPIKEEKIKKDVPIKEEKPSTSDSEDSEDDKPLSARLLIKKNTNLVEAHGSSSRPTNGNISDDKPLSARLSIGKKYTNLDKGHGSSSKPTNGNISGDSDDDKPLSSRSKFNSSVGASTSKSYISGEKKPLASKPQQNGSIKMENQVKKPLSMPSKRPGADPISGEHSAKKLKPSVATGSDKVKPESMKTESEDESDHIPIGQRMKKPDIVKKSVFLKQKVTKVTSSSFKKNMKKKKVNNNSKFSKSLRVPPGSGDGQKWTTLVHNGVIFPPPYKPHRVKMLYDGKPVDLTPEQEEVATMYAVMLETDYVQKPKFNENFFGDWKKLLGKNHTIQDLKKCDFTPIHQWHLNEKEKKKQLTTEEKKAIKEEKLRQEDKYMWAIVDGLKEKVGNFRVEPPGLFRGRGEHPKMGKLKRRIHPSEITINIGKGAPIPECPIPGERWKEVRHDNTVTWLAFWNDPINQKECKYVFLAASSSLKGQSDKEKYEKARMLKDYIQGIRTAYTRDFTSKDMTKQQIAVATYLIDRLALRAGNEKDDDEADTVGCCTLKVENVKPIPPNILEFDFLGKDSIRYHKQFEADPLVFKSVERFRKGKQGSDDLFNELDTSKLNAHLKGLVPGLTAKVFRTYNASITLDNMLSKAAEGDDVGQKVAGYQIANKEVAIICNHQRTVSKSHSAQMERLTEKINELKDLLSELETDMARAKKGKPPLKDNDGKRKRNLTPEAIQKKIVQTKAKIEKMERDMRTKEDLKEIALGTSKINYLDPRITVAWCKRNEVPIEKIFNKSLLAKFAWAMDAEPSFRF